MLKLSNHKSLYAQILNSSYVRYLSKFGDICEIFVTENYGKPILDRDMYVMMRSFGYQFTVSRYIVGRKSSYCVEFGWNIFSQYSSQYVYVTEMPHGVEEVIVDILELAYDADIEMH